MQGEALSLLGACGRQFAWRRLIYGGRTAGMLFGTRWGGRVCEEVLLGLWHWGVMVGVRGREQPLAAQECWVCRGFAPTPGAELLPLSSSEALPPGPAALRAPPAHTVHPLARQRRTELPSGPVNSLKAQTSTQSALHRFSVTGDPSHALSPPGALGHTDTHADTHTVTPGPAW